MNSIVVTGMFWGDEGKGTITAYLAESLPDVRVVVRHSGGCQAAHNVVASDGRHHTFSQFGSGSFTPGVRTHLSHLMMVNPSNLMAESEHLMALGQADILERLTIDRDCLVTTPMHAVANNLRVQVQRLTPPFIEHGTCGLGIGETRWWHERAGDDALFIRDLNNSELVWEKMRLMHEGYLTEFKEYGEEMGYRPERWEEKLKEIFVLPTEEDLAWLRDFASTISIVPRSALAGIIGDGTVIFEGAQGVLLDEKHGFQPHTTWSTTTSHNARRIMREDTDLNEHDAVYLGVTRTYSTRHGNGPFPCERAFRSLMPQGREIYNSDFGTQGIFRVGPWDAAIAEYVADIDQPTHLAVTHCDQIRDHWEVCKNYDKDQSPDVSLVTREEALPLISEALKAPIWIESFGRRTNEKKEMSRILD